MTDSSFDEEQIEYDKHVDFYYTNLINSIILFSLTPDELGKLSELAFDPMFELESEIDYAFTPVCFETVFRNGLIDKTFKPELLKFKQVTDNIPREIWDWEDLNNKAWITVRQEANELLDKLGIKTRTYNDDFITVYDNVGNIIKQAKNCS